MSGSRPQPSFAGLSSKRFDMNRSFGHDAASPQASVMGALRVAAISSIGARSPGDRQLVFDRPELCAITDVGRRRARNEDAICVSPDGRTIAVGDGVAGRRAGHVASELATRSVVRVLCDADAHERDVHSLARSASAALDRTNAFVFDYASVDDDCSGMCCALLAARICDDLLVTAHAGDVRAYLWRPHRLRRLTRDHSLAAELVVAGVLTPEAAGRHSSRGQVRRAIGLSATVEAEVCVVRLGPGDKVLLCSDGLWGILTDPEIAESMASNGSPYQIAADLVDRANRVGGRDNISVVVYQHRMEKSEQLG